MQQKCESSPALALSLSLEHSLHLAILYCCLHGTAVTSQLVSSYILAKITSDAQLKFCHFNAIKYTTAIIRHEIPPTDPLGPKNNVECITFGLNVFWNLECVTVHPTLNSGRKGEGFVILPKVDEIFK